MLSNVHTFILSFTKGYFNYKPLHYTIQVMGSIAAAFLLFSFVLMWLIFSGLYFDRIESHVLYVFLVLAIFDMNFFIAANILSYMVIYASKPPSMTNYVECPPLVFAPIPPHVSDPSIQEARNKPIQGISAEPYNLVTPS